jgi:hypothetical protein
MIQLVCRYLTRIACWYCSVVTFVALLSITGLISDDENASSLKPIGFFDDIPGTPNPDDENENEDEDEDENEDEEDDDNPNEEFISFTDSLMRIKKQAIKEYVRSSTLQPIVTTNVPLVCWLIGLGCVASIGRASQSTRRSCTVSRCPSRLRSTLRFHVSNSMTTTECFWSSRRWYRRFLPCGHLGVCAVPAIICVCVCVDGLDDTNHVDMDTVSCCISAWCFVL